MNDEYKLENPQFKAKSGTKMAKMTLFVPKAEAKRLKNYAEANNTNLSDLFIKFMESKIK
jgi:hypothetical protein